MPLVLGRLRKLRCGPPRASTEVAEVPAEVAAHLKTDLRMVHLSRDVLTKIDRDHPDLADLTFLELPHLFRHGLWVGDRIKPLCAVVSCEGAVTSVRYRAAIKRSTLGLDLWLSSFYRTKPMATRSLLKRGDVIRIYKP